MTIIKKILYVHIQIKADFSFFPQCRGSEAGLISKLMVDILMGGNTQMYYLNGEIDYSTIVTEPRKD